MRLLLVLIIVSFSAWSSDDAEFNPIAKKLKAKILTEIKHDIQLSGFCDVYIYMKHNGEKAVISKVKTSGDYKLCKASKKAIKLNKTFNYTKAEMMIRIHISKP